ncbi:MAG TPA: ABC transporter ATP-binding protein [Bryobacteraceae bacterium]|jgi:ABC-type polysaccharide/polyol phosphate transport system ATPase subunit
MMPIRENPVVISLENVTQRFRVVHERPDTLRELFARFLRHRVTYCDFEAVSNVSFRVHQGEMFGIIGRNGSGKTTLLKLIAGVYKPSIGHIHVQCTIAPLIALGAGMHAELTGRENILLNGLLLGYSKREIQQREGRIIEFSELGDFIDTPVKQYSSGMYMRLAFAVATEVDPDILVIDEILSVGDMSFQQKCFERLRRFRESGKTIVLVSHSMQQVLDYCDRVILLEGGRIMIEGRPKDAIERYQSCTQRSSARMEAVATQ